MSSQESLISASTSSLFSDACYNRISTSFAKKMKSVAGCDQNVAISTTPKTIVICDDNSTNSGDSLVLDENGSIPPYNIDKDVSVLDIPVEKMKSVAGCDEKSTNSGDSLGLEEKEDIGLPNRCLYITELQEKIDQACKILYNPWHSNIIMDMSFLKDNEVVNAKVDISQFMSKDYSIKKYYEQHKSIVYFSLKKYPVSEDAFESVDYKNLQNDLCNSSITDGFYLIRNGFKERKKVYAQEFVCNRYQTYRSNKKKKGDKNSTVYRGCAYNSNHKLSRGPDGLNMSRMTTTLKPLCKENRCKFSFFVSYDNVGFFIVPGAGKNIHIHHPRLRSEHINFPSKLIGRDNRKLMEDMSNAHACLGVSKNLLYKATGRLLSRQKIHWLGGLCNSLKEIENIDKDLNSTEKMIKYLEKNNFEYMMLVHDQQQDKLFNEVNIQSNPYTHSINLPDNERECCFTFAHETRGALEVDPDQSLMMGLSWVLKDEVNFFRLYPEVIFCDVIVHVNKDDCPSLTCTGKDSNGKMFTFLQAFLPNEKQWTFRWIFSVVFPNFFSDSILSRVKVIVTDGCPQEFHQIDADTHALLVATLGNAMQIFFILSVNYSTIQVEGM